MSGTVNKALLIGNLGDEVKIQHQDQQRLIGRFSLATTEVFTSTNTEEKTSQTEWHHIVVRNKLAETCAQYLKKGDKVFVEGKIKTRQWEDQGTTRQITEIIAENVRFLAGSKEKSSERDFLHKNKSINNLSDGFPFG